MCMHCASLLEGSIYTRSGVAGSKYYGKGRMNPVEQLRVPCVALNYSDFALKKKDVFKRIE